MIIPFLLIGVAAGVLSGLFGIGGGIIIVPALIYVAKMTPQQAAEFNSLLDHLLQVDPKQLPPVPPMPRTKKAEKKPSEAKHKRAK